MPLSHVSGGVIISSPQNEVVVVVDVDVVVVVVDVIIVVVVVDVDVDEVDVVVVVVDVLITRNVLHSSVLLSVEFTDMFHHTAVHAEDNDMLYCLPIPFCIKKSGFLEEAFL